MSQLFFLDSNAIGRPARPPGSNSSWGSRPRRGRSPSSTIRPTPAAATPGTATSPIAGCRSSSSYGVQLVLSGHDHNYQRFAARNGVTYVVARRRSAAASLPLRGVRAATRARCAACFEHGFLYFSATDDRLDVSAVVMRGPLIDRFTLRRTTSAGALTRTAFQDGPPTQVRPLRLIAAWPRSGRCGSRADSPRCSRAA